MNNIKHYITFFLLLVLLICSCSEITDHETSDDIPEILFTLEIPAAEDVTRAYDDNAVRNIDLLVFNSSGQFVERVPVNAVSGTGTTKTFSARLMASNTQRIIHLLANVRGDDNSDVISFSHITLGTFLATAITGLTSGTLATGNSPQRPHIMWGRVVLSSITSSTTISAPTPMLRMVASMYVACDTPTAANGLNNFTLTGFSVAGASDRGRVAPSGYSADASTPSTPTMPSPVSTVNYAVNASNLWAVASAGVTSELYLYERANTGTASDLKIIIRGSWNGVEGYYPVWMTDGTSNILNVIRNHRYRVTIKGVYGTGYATPAEAINATPANSQIITDTNDDITDIIVDGPYMLGLSSNKATVSGSGTKTVATVMKTNTSTLTGTSPDGWITSITFTTSGTNRWTLGANFATTSSPRTGTIIVRAGNLTRTIEVTQVP